MKKILAISFVISLFFLGGCGKDKKQIVFDDFIMQVESSFTETFYESKNNQINIIKAYVSKNAQNRFDKNIIVGYIDTKRQYKPDEILNASISDLKLNLLGYKNIKNGQIDFDCKNDKISGVYNVFSIPQKIIDNDKYYFVLQYYFVYKNRLYNISMVSDTNEDVGIFEKYISGLTCKK